MSIRNCCSIIARIGLQSGSLADRSKNSHRDRDFMKTAIIPCTPANVMCTFSRACAWRKECLAFPASKVIYSPRLTDYFPEFQSPCRCPRLTFAKRGKTVFAHSESRPKSSILTFRNHRNSRENAQVQNVRRELIDLKVLETLMIR